VIHANLDATKILPVAYEVSTDFTTYKIGCNWEELTRMMNCFAIR
jgi:hypothetical protein